MGEETALDWFAAGNRAAEQLVRATAELNRVIGDDGPSTVWVGGGYRVTVTRDPPEVPAPPAAEIEMAP